VFLNGQRVVYIRQHTDRGESLLYKALWPRTLGNSTRINLCNDVAKRVECTARLHKQFNRVYKTARCKDSDLQVYIQNVLILGGEPRHTNLSDVHHKKEACELETVAFGGATSYRYHIV
jgi:hypothetical protein